MNIKKISSITRKVGPILNTNENSSQVSIKKIIQQHPDTNRPISDDGITTIELSNLENSYDIPEPHLMQPLNEVLTPEQIDALNDKINNAVKEAGPGTGEAVSAAIKALIEGLREYGITLPYYLGGGHEGIGNGIYNGVDPTWGQETVASGYTTDRYYNSLDCTGLLLWATRNAGITLPAPYEPVNPNDMNTGHIMDITQSCHKIDVREAKPEDIEPGDIVVNEEHVIIILDSYTNENGELVLVTAESSPSEDSSGQVPIPGEEINLEGPYTGGVHIQEYTASEMWDNMYLADDYPDEPVMITSMSELYMLNRTSNQKEV